jgi:histidinol-phosphatase
MSRELDVAVAAAIKAEELALRLQPGITAENKSDNSPVTKADKECERLIAGMIAEEFPGDGILGEEGARVESTNGRRWIIDPIDGTRDYLRGNPLWANLIALEADGEIVVGVVNLPMLGNLYKASLHGGAFCNDAPIRASEKKLIRESVLCFSGFNKLNATTYKEGWLDWMAKFWAVRGLGGAPDAMLVASGQADLWVEPTAASWDLAPLKVILDEAGARFVNFGGGNSVHAGNCVAFAPGLENELDTMWGESWRRTASRS